ncbi:MAG: phage head closure protein [Fimbriimonadaceae bacterium]|nr:phage head closure protein [Alphaproteobacteria bacterium]
MAGTTAGSLRHRVMLEAPVETADGAGGVDLDWSPVAGLWAEIRPLSGGEQLAFGRAHASLTTRVTIRYRGAVASDMRFRLGVRILEIRQIADPDGLKRWLECICEERPQ